MERNIILIDDDLDVLETLEKHLSLFEKYFRLNSFNSGQEAIKNVSELAKQKVPIDVFIVDQKMESDEEDAQGLQLISSFHDHYPDAVYLIISGHITRKQWLEFQENIIEEKFNGSLTEQEKVKYMIKIAKRIVEDVIPKPWDERELQQTVLEHLLKKIGPTPGLVCPFYKAVYVNKGNLPAYKLVYDEKKEEFPCCDISDLFEAKQIKKCQWIRPLGTSVVDEDGTKYYQCDNAIYRHFLDGKNVAIVKKGDSNKILHKWLFFSK